MMNVGKSILVAGAMGLSRMSGNGATLCLQMAVKLDCITQRVAQSLIKSGGSFSVQRNIEVLGQKSMDKIENLGKKVVNMTPSYATFEKGYAGIGKFVGQTAEAGHAAKKVTEEAVKKGADVLTKNALPIVGAGSALALAFGTTSVFLTVLDARKKREVVQEFPNTNLPEIDLKEETVQEVLQVAVQEEIVKESSDPVQKESESEKKDIIEEGKLTVHEEEANGYLASLYSTGGAIKTFLVDNQNPILAVSAVVSTIAIALLRK